MIELEPQSKDFITPDERNRHAKILYDILLSVNSSYISLRNQGPNPPLLARETLRDVEMTVV
jgi:hypothetical protein